MYFLTFFCVKTPICLFCLLSETSHCMTRDGFGSGSMGILEKHIVGECQCQVAW